MNVNNVAVTNVPCLSFYNKFHFIRNNSLFDFALLNWFAHLTGVPTHVRLEEGNNSRAVFCVLLFSGSDGENKAENSGRERQFAVFL